jgi:hypothetical protein
MVATTDGSTSRTNFDRYFTIIPTTPRVVVVEEL